MKSGLEGRNNTEPGRTSQTPIPGLNEVRPRRPEQYSRHQGGKPREKPVSMKSGLEGRNNLEILTETREKMQESQ